MTAEAVLARIADTPSLPTPPALTLRILEQANRPNCGIAEIGKMISQDPAMCGRMLKLINSSLYGLHRPVTSIDRALSLLGLKHARSLVLSLSLPMLRARTATSEWMKGYWKTSVTIAMVCRELAVKNRWADPDSEMVAGLLCDFGELLLKETFPEEAARFAAAAPAEWMQRQCSLEVEHFGIDHAEAGAHFLTGWKLGAGLTEAIRFHHRPDDAPPQHAERARLLSFASHIAHLHRQVNRHQAIEAITRMADRYRLSKATLPAFLAALDEKIAEFAGLIDLDLQGTETHVDLFSQSTENLVRFAMEASLENVRAHVEKEQVERNLQEATEALQKSEQQLYQAQKLDAIGRLAGGIAHDFNNLLTVINGNCDLLLDLPCLDDEARDMVELILQSGQRAADLTRQLVAFSRKQQLVFQVTDLNAILENVSRLVRRLIGADIELVTAFAPDLAPVKVDPQQMEQVILNLAVNARDAMPEGGRLTFSTFNLLLESEAIGENTDLVPGRYSVFSVRDTGCGMDDEVAKRIFEPFFTTKAPGKGSGLGLATVHGIVRQSNGQITVSSTPGAGAIFRVYLPSVDVEIAENASANGDTAPSVGNRPAVVASAHGVRTPPDSAALRGDETILLVEDDVRVRDLAQRVLSDHGYNVLPASDGAEALERDQNHPQRIHLLITDRTMPRIGGWELVRQMRARRPDIKIIFMSGHSDDSSAPRQLDARMIFLEKPFGSDQLVRVVRAALNDTTVV